MKNTLFFNFPLFFFILFNFLIKETLQSNSTQLIHLNTSSYANLNSPLNNCQQFKIPANYKKLKISLNSTNISFLVASDKNIQQSCIDGETSHCCDDSASLCMKFYHTEIKEFTINNCVDSVYIYTCNNGNDGKVTISNTINNANGGCYNFEMNPYSECANLGTKQCRDQNVCSSKCKYVNCKDDKNSTLLKMCLPANAASEEILDRCRSHQNYSDTVDPIIRECFRVEEDESDNPLSHKVIKFIAVLFGISVLITFIASVYYRFKINIDNSVPFEPPSFCPDFVFPKTMNF